MSALSVPPEALPAEKFMDFIGFSARLSWVSYHFLIRVLSYSYKVKKIHSAAKLFKKNLLASINR